MKIPKIFNRKYEFVEQCNKNLFRYRHIAGYSECFTRFDLGMIHEPMEKSKNIRLISKY